MIKMLLDTGVWISYFGDRPANQQKRIQTAQSIIDYCVREKIKLFYCPYVEKELCNGKNKTTNIEKMKNIANKLPAHIGNDTWDQIYVEWEDLGSSWNNDEEVKLGNQFQQQLPDKKNKSNRIDRNIVITAINQKIDFILHENPRDYIKLNVDGISFIDLLKIKSLDKFIKIISNNK